MGSKSIVYALCLLGALTAAACGDDDAVGNGSGGTGGTGGKGSAGTSGKAGAATGGGNTGGGNTGGGNTGGGNTAGDAGTGGEAGMAGSGPTCTDYTAFVHSVIKNDTNATSAPRDLNGVVFCPDPANPAAYNDLF